MIAATNNAQGWTRAGAGEAPGCGMGKPAPVAMHQFQSRHTSRRATRRGLQHAPAFFFTPVSIDLDEIHQLRICELTGRQAVLSRALLSSASVDAGGIVPIRIKPGADQPLTKPGHSESLSAVARLNDRDRDMRKAPRAGTAFWKAGNVIC